MFTVHGWLCVNVCVDAVRLNPPAAARNTKLKLPARSRAYYPEFFLIESEHPPAWQLHVLASAAEGRIMKGYKWEEAHTESPAGAATQPQKRV